MRQRSGIPAGKLLAAALFSVLFVGALYAR
jgi:hypothetical protein